MHVDAKPWKVHEQAGSPDISCLSEQDPMLTINRPIYQRPALRT